MSEWFKEWFGDDYLRVYNHRDTEDAKALIDTITKNIVLSSDALILDAACGAGRHSIILSKLGYNVVGFDLSKKLLSIAEDERNRLGLKIHYINSDLRQVYFKKKFDLVFNAFTSFGYFQNDEENYKFIRNSFEFLKPGGYYILDYLNKNFLLENLVAESEKTVAGITISEKRRIDKDRVVKNILLKIDGATKNYMESVKLYDKVSIISQFEEIGFKALKLFGDYYGAEFEEKTSQRLIIIFQK